MAIQSLAPSMGRIPSKAISVASSRDIHSALYQSTQLEKAKVSRYVIIEVSTSLFPGCPWRVAWIVGDEILEGMAVHAHFRGMGHQLGFDPD